MRKALCRTLVSAVLLSTLGCATEVAVTEGAAPRVQSPVRVTPTPVPSRKPAWLTPEKETALIEVRKILREAREVAEQIQPPSSMWIDRHWRKALERMKDEVLHRIEDTQLQAGDMTIPSRHKESLALAQARYGFTN